MMASTMLSFSVMINRSSQHLRAGAQSEVNCCCPFVNVNDFNDAPILKTLHHLWWTVMSCKSLVLCS